MSILTAAQRTTLKTFINGDVNISGQPQNSDGAAFIATYLNTVVSPNFFVYRTNVPVNEIYDQITWANLTPTDAADGTTLWQNRSMVCQGKQLNFQILVQGGQSTINASRANIRAGLQDALTNVPSGATGALVSAGWVNVRDNALARLATRFEKVFSAGGNGSTAALAGTMAVEGPIAYQDVQDARDNG